jgi:mannose-6-phosphate isomerase-like protein (cupin superfamily)
MPDRPASVQPAATGTAVWFLDDLLEIKLTGEDTEGALCVLEDPPAPGFRPLLHLHRNEDEIVHVIEGELLFVTDEGEREIGPGALVHVPRGKPHAFHNPGTAHAHRLVMFTPAGVERFFLEVGVPASDRSAPPAGGPGPRELLEVAARYGWEIIPPS